MTASAQTTSFTAKGWVNGVPVPGILCTNAQGQVLLRGLVHTARIEGSDPRVTGQLLILGDASYNADGTAISQGTAYLQVGTWDAAGATFTPTGAMWETRYRGPMQTDSSFRLSITGYGSGGDIDGLRSEATLTQAAAPAPIDFTIPYDYTGTITPPPLSSTLDSDDFSAGVAEWTAGRGSGTVMLAGTDQMVLQAQFPGPSSSSSTTCAWAMRSRPWTVENGQALELSVDLVSLGAATTEALLAIGKGVGQPCYTLTIGRDYVTLNKWSSGLAVLRGDKVPLKSTNLTVVLALRRAGESLEVNARVMDIDRPGVILHEATVLDRPSVDPTLSNEQLEAVCGVGLTDLRADPDEPPWTSGEVVWLGLWQQTDGSRPPAEVTFDSFRLHLYDVPPIASARAVQLTWPIPFGVNDSVERATNVLGPFLPLQELPLPGMQEVTVPASDQSEFFRLRQAP